MERQGVAGGCNARRITEAGILFTVKKKIHPSFSGLLRACELLVEESNPARGGGGGRGAGLGGKHTEYSGSSNEPARGESRGQPETVSCPYTSTDVCVTFTQTHYKVIFIPPCFRVCSLLNKCFRIGNVLVFSLYAHVLLSLEGTPWAPGTLVP